MATKSENLPKAPPKLDPREKKLLDKKLALEKERFNRPLIHMKNGKLLISN
jgi:hypothetical protein